MSDSGSVKLTAKRQVTFPKEVCDELGIREGDRLLLQRRKVDGEWLWTIKPVSHDRPWLHQLRKYAKGKNHSIEAVRASIAKKR